MAHTSKTVSRKKGVRLLMGKWKVQSKRQAARHCVLILISFGVITAPTAFADNGDYVEQSTFELTPVFHDVDGRARAEVAEEPFVRSRMDGDIRRVSVLVHFDPALARQAVKRNNVGTFVQATGGFAKYEYKLLPNVVNFRDIPDDQVAEIAKMPGVTKVEFDMYHPKLVRLHESTQLIRGLQSQLGAAGLNVDGSGIRVAVCDTGIDIDHVMYADRIDSSAGYDFYNNDSNPDDDNGHGTHCAGISVGAAGLSIDFGCGAGSQPFQGVAPGATLIGVKILNSGGGGFDSDIIAGIDHAADQSPSGGRADVINLSIGTGNFASGNCGHSWAVAANNAVANGVVVVAASGNENRTNSMGSPACGASVIAVGATWKADYPTCEDAQTNWNWGVCTDFSPGEDDVVCFSNESDFLDVSAPGANIWSASNAAGGGSIAGQSGTSMASPQVAGLAALILEADPTLTPAEVRQVIRDGAIDLGPAGFDRGYGHGRIDVINSLNLVSTGGCTTNGDCDDGLYCNGAETCSGGTCVSGTAPNCNDGIACTNDSCNESTDSCNNTPVNGNCDDGLYCNGSETCSATFGCQSGSAPNCNDGIACTNDSCNESTDSCNNVPDNSACDDGVFCNGAETCSPSTGCNGGSDPCPGQFCDEGSDNCFDCVNDGDCDDGLFCNGAETCSGGNCQSGGDPCPGQGCDEGSDTCGGCGVDADCDDGSDCTNDVCSGGQCFNDCPANVSSFPYSENFESGTGAWANVSGDNFDWTRDAGGTPSSSTGPSGDHTTGSGWYMYIETSSPRVNGDTAILEGPCVDLTGRSDGTMDFWYHMYGATVNSLTVQASTDCSNWTNVWSLSGNQGNSWNSASVDLSAYSDQIVTLRFVGVRGTSYTGDIAIDDISIDAVDATPCFVDADCNDGDACTIDDCTGGVCQNTAIDCDDGNACTTDSCAGGVCTNACDSEVASYPYDEDFDVNFGNWNNLSGDDFDWSRNSGGTPSSNTGPSGDHTSGSGSYVYIETSSPRVNGDTAILESDCFDLAGVSGPSLGFWYHMYGGTIGSLTVEVSDDCQNWTTEWSLSGNQGNAWNEANIDLSAYAGSLIRIRFIGVRGSSYTGDISIDDVSLTATTTGCSIDADCDDGQFCNGDEFCSGGTCQAGAPVNCNDGISCTSDSCNEGSDSCDNVPNNGLCDDGAYCNGSETCSAAVGCLSGSDPCPGEFCDESSDSCVECLIDADCDDGLFCNGDETCNGGTCEFAMIGGGVTNGTFDGSSGWSASAPAGGSSSYGGNLTVVGPDAGSQGFAWSSQSGVDTGGADLEFDLLSYSSGDTGQWDYPVFYLDGTFYGLNSNGTLGAATSGGNGGAGSISNGLQVSSSIHFVVDIDALAGSGPHTIGFGVQSSDGGFGAGTAVFDNVTPEGGSGPCAPGETCDEGSDSCLP